MSIGIGYTFYTAIERGDTDTVTFSPMKIIASTSYRKDNMTRIPRQLIKKHTKTTFSA